MSVISACTGIGVSDRMTFTAHRTSIITERKSLNSTRDPASENKMEKNLKKHHPQACTSVHIGEYINMYTCETSHKTPITNRSSFNYKSLRNYMT